jgi:hypothetical protein
MKTPNTKIAKYEIDDEIEDLNTIMIISFTTSNESSIDTESFIGKATLFDLMSSSNDHLPTPNRTLEPDNNAPPPSIAFAIAESFLITSAISVDFNA